MPVYVGRQIVGEAFGDIFLTRIGAEIGKSRDDNRQLRRGKRLVDGHAHRFGLQGALLGITAAPQPPRIPPVPARIDSKPAAAEAGIRAAVGTKANRVGAGHLFWQFANAAHPNRLGTIFGALPVTRRSLL